MGKLVPDIVTKLPPFVLKEVGLMALIDPMIEIPA